MDSTTFLISRDIQQYFIKNIENSDETKLINLIESKYKNINYHCVYATIEQYLNTNLSREEQERRCVKLLQKIPQFEQRSQEWYDLRKGMITASDIATVINDNPYQKPITVLRKKCGLDDKFVGNKFTEWGVKYEEIANMIYSIDYNTTVIEFGLIQHPYISFLGASPDGITPDGVMLEIKCPYVRELKPEIEHGGVPHYYWIQVQIQLEVCNLEYCDFQQCKLYEYENKDEYISDNFDGYKGCVVNQRIGNNKLKYIYPPSLKMSDDELNEWLKQYENEDDYFVTWWKLTNMLYTRLQRDREWFTEKLPILEEFWKDILYYRRHGNDEIKPKKRVKKIKPDIKPIPMAIQNMLFSDENTSENTTKNTSENTSENTTKNTSENTSENRKPIPMAIQNMLFS